MYAGLSVYGHASVNRLYLVYWNICAQSSCGQNERGYLYIHPA